VTVQYKPIVSQPSAARPLDHGRRVGGAASLLSSNRFVLGSALMVAVAVPILLHEYLGLTGPWFRVRPEGMLPTLLIVCAAIVGGHLSLQRLGTLPLITARQLILPSFLVFFGVATLVLYAFRVPVGRYQVWTALAVSVCWYYAVAIMRARLLRPVIGLLGIPGRVVRALPGNVEWRIVTEQHVPANIAAVVVDPHSSLDMGSSHLITQLVLEGVPVYHRSHFEEGLTGKVRFATEADNNFGALLPSLTYLRLKRIVDVAGAILLLPLVALILLPALLAVKLDSPGPLLFRQTRTGYRGRPFTCYKLRTMRCDQDGPAFTLQGDGRITRCGRFLRQWRIDELPQVLNILKGDMSWIGPRPEAIELATYYSRHVPFYEYRHAVRPGISGWAAVHQGNVGEVDAAREKLEYDFYYIKYFSVWLDVLIVFKTIRTVMTGFGSR